MPLMLQPWQSGRLACSTSLGRSALGSVSVCVCVCVCARVHVCVRTCMHACMGGGKQGCCLVVVKQFDMLGILVQPVSI